MATARELHTATLLSDGRVLIIGGSDGSKELASVELYDPATGTFSPTGSLATPRDDFTATALSDGRVLVAGGQTDVTSTLECLASTELYDPATGTFSPTGSMTAARCGQTATALSDGRVLMAGGQDAGFNVTASAELYDPATGKFSSTGSMTAARDGATATTLSDGRVLIAGGANGSGVLASAELYDPATGKFSSTGSMTAARDGATATTLSDGRILIVGGETDMAPASDRLASAELYDPASGKFSPTGSLTIGRDAHTATLLPDGRVLIAGGWDGSATLASAELYDPATGKFMATSRLTSAREFHTATLLPAGRVLIAGGEALGTSTFETLASAELYQP
jgi:uncharacterized delta-60 repeat protein